MSHINTVNENNISVGSLLNSTNRVEAPFIRLSIGGYTFGVYESSKHGVGQNKLYTRIDEKYPSYVRSLTVKKINGTVNQYTINISYPVTPNNDPSFFDKLFGQAAQDRRILISYGDFMIPEYIYKDEEAIITSVSEQVDVRSSVINYTIQATSSVKLSLGGCFNFPQTVAKPSDLIYQTLYTNNSSYHLLDVFTGMRDRKSIEQLKLISSDDAAVEIPACVGISALEYISLLVKYMSNVNGSSDSVYTITTYEDTSGRFGGPYFTVKKVDRDNTDQLDQLATYTIDIGYPTSNIVTDFRITRQDNWTILYDYNREVQNQVYSKTIDSNGNLVDEKSPLLPSSKYGVDSKDIQWWKKVTGFPIQAEITVKGLLKPAILMTYVKINTWMYGRKHISSGYYIITSQTDKIDDNGFFTTLGLTKISGDDIPER